ncbi:MAG: TrkA family potassium uptake protein [Eubacteriales bacterium]
MKSFLVIGLGRFGSSIAKELCALDNEVLVLDLNEELTQAMADQVTSAVTGDACDPDVLKTIGVRNFDCAVVCCGSDIGNSALITLTLKEIGVPQVIAKANNATHRKVLEKTGADMVILPEKEMAERLAQNLSNNDVLNFIELSDEFSIVELRLPQSWVGKSIIELHVRAQYHLNIIAVRTKGEDLVISPSGHYCFQATDSVVVLGENMNIEKLEHD